MMKHFFLLFLFLSLLAVQAFAQEVPNVPNIRITLINQEPNPVEPGEHLIVRFRVENLGGQPAENMKVEVLQSYPFSLAGQETGIRELGILGGTQRDRLGAVVSYDLLVDPSKSEGTADLFLRYSFGSVIAKTGPYNISIRARQAVLTISSFTSEPEQVAPGKKANLTLFITNNAKSMLKDIQVKLDLSAVTIPFAPISVAAEKSVSQLSPGETASLRFSLVALPESSSGVFKMPVKITFVDQIGKNFSKDDMVSMTIGGKPSLIALVSDQAMLKKGESGEVTVQIVNNGLVNAKLATLEIAKDDSYDLISPSKIYIGSIDSDDFDTSTLNVFVKSDRIRMPAVLAYSDANNNEYMTEFILEPRVYTGSELNSFGTQKSSVVGFVIIAAIIIAGLLLYRKFFRKRE